MELDKETLAEYVYDPNRTQQLILSYLEGATNGNLKITEPTNPFTMLMEAAVVSGANAVTEPLSLFRKLYPNLAETAEDLRHHLSDSELANMFSIPSEAALVFYLNVKDIQSHGYRPDGATHVETIVPIGTEIVVANTTFTLLNRIFIKLYDEGVVFVEQENNDNDISINSLGVLSSGIVSFKDGEPWVIFETTVKQVKKHTISKTILATEGFDKVVSITDKYFYSEVKYKNSYTNNTYQKLLKTHAEDFINSSTPTVYINIMDKDIRFKIPDTYLIDNLVSGNGLIEIYETKGAINLAIDKYKMEEFAVSVETQASNTTEASIANINIMVNSRTSVEGGKDSITVSELKDSIINNSTGDIDIPITTHNISRKGSFDNFEIFKALDVVTSRIFIASKNLPDLDSSLLYAKPDIFFNKLSLAVSDVTNMSTVKASGDYLLIESNTVFKENNYKIEIVRDAELSYIASMNNSEKMFKLKETKYFFTPYHYIIDTTDADITKSRVYDLDNPLLKDIKITGKNTNILTRVNTDQYGVFKTDTGYKVVFTLITNQEFDLLNPALIKGQFSIPLIGEDTKLHFEAEYDKANNRFEFDIETDLFVDADDYITIKNGTAVISNKLVSLVNDCEMYIYTKESSVIDATNYLASDIVFDNEIVVFSKEVINLTLGTNIEYIWNRFYNTYSERMYQKYTYDLPLVYEEDVYEIDPETGSVFNCVDDGEGGVTAVRNLLHSKGEPVLDDDGLPVYKFRSGDVILDKDNKPIIDTISGVIRNIDIMMLEYEFKIATSTPYKNYLDIVLSTISNWLYISVPKLNDSLLENTEILYRSYKTVETINVKSNDTINDIRYNITPTVTLYSKLSSYTNSETETIRNAVGTIIHKHLNSTTIQLSTIKEDIMATLGSDIVGVKISGIDTANDAEVFTIVDNTKRLILDKSLSINQNNDLIVKYNVNLSINTI